MYGSITKLTLFGQGNRFLCNSYCQDCKVCQVKQEPTKFPLIPTSIPLVKLEPTLKLEDHTILKRIVKKEPQAFSDPYNWHRNNKSAQQTKDTDSASQLSLDFEEDEEDYDEENRPSEMTTNSQKEDSMIQMGSLSSEDNRSLVLAAGLIQKTSEREDERFRRRKKNRKVRTTITREKLAMMNQIFADYTRQKEEGKNPRCNLKEIGSQLSLGYSTILHKYREYRSSKVVKGGALIASLQKKRKYKKSITIERTIEEALQKQSFYTAVELSEYIYRETNKRFSRSIISRHLGEMGYSYKNLKISPIEKNKPKYKENRRIYASILLPFITTKNYLLVYIDEFALSVSTFLKKKHGAPDKLDSSEGDYVSVIAGASTEGILHFHVKHGFYTRGEFCDCVASCFSALPARKYLGRYFAPEKSYLITDMNKIHLDPEEGEDRPVARVLAQVQAHRLFLPPASPQLNPLDGIFATLKHRLQKRDVRGVADLQELITKQMVEISKETTDIYFKDVLNSLERSKTEENL